MSAPSSSAPDFLLSKSDAELVFLVQNPSFYHEDLVSKARGELQRRGVAIPRPQAELDVVPDLYTEPAEAPRRTWLGPALGVSLALVAAGALLWPKATPKSAAPVAAAPPAELVAVPTHMLPTFDSLTTAQLKTVPTTLPAAERADTAAQRKFLILARRFWEAENQSNYLFDQVAANQLDATFPGQVNLTLDKWRRLTSVLVYSHRLQPTMLAQLRQMGRVALIRRSTLEAQLEAYQMGAPLLSDYSMLMNDSVLYVRQGLLGVPESQRLRPGTVTKRKVKPAPDALAVATLPPPRPGHNPLYILDGKLLASNMQTGEAPEQVTSLGPAAIASITVLNKAMAVRKFGPRAHDGAVVIITKAEAAAFGK